MTEVTSGEARLTTRVRDDWGSGRVVEAALVAAAPINGWRVTIEAGGLIVEIWNAQIVARAGSRYTLEAADGIEALAAGSAITFGFKVEGADGTDAAPGPTVPVGLHTTPASVAALVNGPLPEPADAAPPEPAAPMRLAAAPGDGPRVAGGAYPEPRGDSPEEPRDGFAPGPFFARAATIVDAGGEPARLHGLNWFGFETETLAPHGLWARNWRTMMDEVKALGFNVLRLPLSGELVASGGGRPSGIDIGLNPDLAGLDGLQILDAIVGYADVIGLRIVLDYHRGPPGSGPNESGLWYGAGRTEADVVAEWRTLAERYGEAPAVIGADLVNEPFLATWGDGSATDWAAAAARIGKAVLAIAPHWLIIVEGVAVYRGEPYWWGGNLQGVRDHPVALERPDKLVYSAHDYPPSLHDQPWFADGSELADVFERNWGYLAQEGLAPVLLGEWGSRLATAEDRAWAASLSQYLARHDIPWLWWALNPNSGDTGGLLEDDWSTVRPEVVQLLAPFLGETRPAPVDVAGGAATFTVTLPAPAAHETLLPYATVDGSAEAGRDYVATAGTLTFAPGETRKSIKVPLLPDALLEAEEVFYLVVGAGSDRRTSAAATISDAERQRRGEVLAPLDYARPAGGEAQDSTFDHSGVGARATAGDAALAVFAPADTGAAPAPQAIPAAPVADESVGDGPAAASANPGGEPATDGTQRVIDLILAGEWAGPAGADAGSTAPPALDAVALFNLARPAAEAGNAGHPHTFSGEPAAGARAGPEGALASDPGTCETSDLALAAALAASDLGLLVQ